MSSRDLTIDLLLASQLGICGCNDMRNEVCDLPMKIDYLGHSGFFVETDSVLLLFDYYSGDLSFIGQKPDDKAADSLSPASAVCAAYALLGRQGYCGSV